MPSATSSSSGPSNLPSLLHTLQHSLQTDPSSAAEPLASAKRQLLHANALIPTTVTPSETLHIARSILETGALISIHLKDSESFVRYWSQLQPFYEYEAADYQPSRDRSKITGLYLLLLLSQGDYVSFHTVLEGLMAAEEGDESGRRRGEGGMGGSVVERDPYIRYPVELERNLMEGSYDQVWKKTMAEAVPAEEFALFSEVGHSFLFFSLSFLRKRIGLVKVPFDISTFARFGQKEKKKRKSFSPINHSPPVPPLVVPSLALT